MPLAGPWSPPSPCSRSVRACRVGVRGPDRTLVALETQYLPAGQPSHGRAAPTRGPLDLHRPRGYNGGRGKAPTLAGGRVGTEGGAWTCRQVWADAVDGPSSGGWRPPR